MILGDEEWQRKTVCAAQEEVQEGHKQPCAHCRDGDERHCDRFWRALGGSGRSYARNPDLWKLSKRGDPSTLSDPLISLLEIGSAIDWLEREHYEAWECLTHTWFAKPRALGGRGRWSNYKAAEYFGIDERTVRRRCCEGLQLMAGRILDVIAPETLTQLGRE